MQNGNRVAVAVFSTSLGWAGVAVSGKGVVRVLLPRKSRRAAERDLTRKADRKSVPAAGSVLLKNAVRLVKGILSGDPVDLEVPLDLGRYTPFQRAVWKATASIGSGKTRSYSWVATRIGRPKAARAVGRAMGANPVPLLVP